ncbi:MAG: replication protein [Defluviitaleaceae bacterium]|nr:replication protein [Defluviitaleaceae bacterium]
MEAGRGAKKTRNWAGVVYPESAPEGWQDMLRDTHVKSFISPLHDRDVDADGDLLKAHFHVVINTDGPITQKRANEIFEPLCGTKSAEYVMSLSGYVRYLAHMDNPEKAQYDPTEIIALNGADLTSILKNSQTDINKYIGEVMNFCVENQIYELSTLSHYAMREESDWFAVITAKPYLFVQYLASLRHGRINLDSQSNQEVKKKC